MGSMAGFMKIILSEIIFSIQQFGMLLQNQYLTCSLFLMRAVRSSFLCRRKSGRPKTGLPLCAGVTIILQNMLGHNIKQVFDTASNTPVDLMI